MIRGTTPSFALSIEGYDLSEMTVYVTIGQGGTKIIKTGDDLDVSYNNNISVILVMLSQKDTLQLQKGKAYVEVKFINGDGEVWATDTAELTVVEKTLLEKAIVFVGGDENA